MSWGEEKEAQLLTKPTLTKSEQRYLNQRNDLRLAREHILSTNAENEVEVEDEDDDHDNNVELVNGLNKSQIKQELIAREVEFDDGLGKEDLAVLLVEALDSEDQEA